MAQMLFAWGMQPIENSLVARLTPEKLRATSYGLKSISTLGVGSLPVITEKHLIKHYGFVKVFWFQPGVIYHPSRTDYLVSRVPVEEGAIQKLGDFALPPLKTLISTSGAPESPEEAFFLDL